MSVDILHIRDIRLIFPRLQYCNVLPRVWLCVSVGTKQSENYDIDEIPVLEVEKETLQFVVIEVFILPARDKSLEDLTLLVS